MVLRGVLSLTLSLTDVLLLLGGAGAGFINAVAGGGSALTLPLLMLTGLDASVANGTNRVAVAAQALTASATFHHQQVRPWTAVLRAGCWALPGAVIGAFVAIHIPPPALERVFGVLFLALAALLTARPKWLVPDPDPEAFGDWPSAGGGLMLFGVGLYGGVFQAGVGIPLLVVLVQALRLDLVRANAVKVALVLVYTTAILGVFGGADQIDWRSGAILAVGGLGGSFIGARAAIAKGAPFIRRLVFVALILAGARALGLFELIFG